MKQKALLILFGLICGAIPCVAIYYYLNQKTSASEFASIDDLRRSMLTRDSKDLRDDQSVSLRSIITPHPSDEIIYELLPNLDVKFQGVQVKTNSCGMRGREVRIEKPPGTYRIALLGDSFAFGWGVEEAQIFARILEEKLSELLNGPEKVEVLNFGTPGYSTFQEVAKFKKDGMDFNPDLVLIYFVENDFGLPFFIKGVGANENLMPATVFARLSWSRKNPEIEKQNQFLLGVMDPNKSIESLFTTLSERGTKLAVAINPGKSWKKDKERLWILKKRKKIITLPLKRDYDLYMANRNIPKEKLVLPTDPHPSALKHRILGEILASQLLRTVAQSQS